MGAGEVFSTLSPAVLLAGLRTELRQRGLDGFLIPRADEHLGEYVPACAERLAVVSGFTGSAGLAVVLADRAALFVDGRYTEQADEQADPAVWSHHHLIQSPPPAWLRAHAPGARIGYDPWLHSAASVAQYRAEGVDLVAVATNPLDAVWIDRPAPPMARAFAHPPELAGRDVVEKRNDVAALLTRASQDAAVITDPASVCWLLNMRGADVPFTPFALGFAVVHADARVDLVMAPDKLPADLRAGWGGDVRVHDRAALTDVLKALAGRCVRVDRTGSPAWFEDTLRGAEARVVDDRDPCLLPKACKNDTEQQGARAAQHRDAVALCRFLAWLDRTAPQGGLNEASAAAELLRLRQQVEGFREESFPAISAAGAHAALPHYRVTTASNAPLADGQVYLIDSGAQYPDGTTDVTRTIWVGTQAPSAILRDRFTRVLLGHISIATLRFPRGCAGAHLDGFARRALWDQGLDYDHGTGHGVGSYLSVHEGPASISRASKTVDLAEGMILSNEPGFYVPGEYGIRLENLVLVHGAPQVGARPFLCFETLTLAPFDRRLIDLALLDVAALAWLDAYHARVLAQIGPELDDQDRRWLAAACARMAQ